MSTVGKVALAMINGFKAKEEDFFEVALAMLWVYTYSGCLMSSTTRVLLKRQKGLFYEYNANHGTKGKFEKRVDKRGNIQGLVCA